MSFSSCCFRPHFYSFITYRGSIEHTFRLLPFFFMFLFVVFSCFFSFKIALHALFSSPLRARPEILSIDTPQVGAKKLVRRACCARVLL